MFGVAKFGNMIPLGHYSYPFSFLLPASMPASVTINSGNYIHYTLEAVVHGFDASNDQIFKRNLHVREPPRGVPRMLSGESVSESFCCGCCCNCGSCQLMIEADVTSFQYDQIFHVKGRIDTSMSKTPVKNFKAAIR